jgi:hypothetical protein
MLRLQTMLRLTCNILEIVTTMSNIFVDCRNFYITHKNSLLLLDHSYKFDETDGRYSRHLVLPVSEPNLMQD